MRVVGSGGKHVGYVKLVDGDRLLVGRPSAPDIYLPLEIGRMTRDDRFILNIPASEVANLARAQAQQGTSVDSWSVGIPKRITPIATSETTDPSSITTASADGS